MDNEISKNVIPAEGSVTLPIAEYHQLLNNATRLDVIVSEKETEFNAVLDAKEKEITEEHKKFAKLQEKIKKGLKIASDNIAQLNTHGEKDVRRAGMLQEALLDGLDTLIEDFDEVSDEALKERANKPIKSEE